MVVSDRGLSWSMVAGSLSCWHTAFGYSLFLSKMAVLGIGRVFMVATNKLNFFQSKKTLFPRIHLLYFPHGK